MVKLVLIDESIRYFDLNGYIKKAELITGGASDFIQLTVNDTPATVDLIYSNYAEFEEAFSKNRL